MRAPNRKEAAALAKQHAIADAENRREDWWHLMPVFERERAMSIAGLPRERAIMPLATFTDAERNRVRIAIEAHVHRMGLIAQALHARNTNIHGWLH